MAISFKILSARRQLGRINLSAAIILPIAVCMLTACAKDEPFAASTPTPDPSPIITPDTPEPSPENTPEMGRISEITDLTHTQTIDVTGGYVLVVAGWYPQTGVEAIDNYYIETCEEFVSKAENLAEELRSYDGTSAGATQYSLDDNYEIVKNSDNIFSIHRTVYQYTGGAHGNHADVCDNFRISDGTRLTLDDIFDCMQDEYTADICNVFDTFIGAHGSGDDNYYFFDDAGQMLRDIFPLGTFCVTDTGLNFYISPYFITPYSSGTVVIPVAWDDLSVPRKDIGKAA